MAARPEHDPKNRTVKARLTKAWQKSGSDEVFGYVPYVINPLNTRFRDFPDALCMVFGGVALAVGGIGGAVVKSNYPEFVDQTRHILPEIEQTLSFSQNLITESGYIAVSNNNGDSGYALFNVDGDYRLYYIGRSSENESRLKLIGDADEAWRISSQLMQDFVELNEAAINDAVSPDVSDWEVMTLPNLTVYAKDSDGDIVRFSDRLQDYDEQNGWSLLEQYQDVQNIWQVATQHFIHEDASIPEDEFSSNAGKLTVESYQVPNPRYENEMTPVPWFCGIGGALILFGSIPPIVRRRKYLKHTH